MSHDEQAREQASAHPPAASWLERVTAVVLVLALLALSWIVVVAYQPSWGRLPTVEAEVLVLLGLLTAALGLVSVVALAHTRTR